MRFTIRELLLVTVIVAMGLALVTEHIYYRRAAHRLTMERNGEFNRRQELRKRISMDGYAIVDGRFYRIVDEGLTGVINTPTTESVTP